MVVSEFNPLKEILANDKLMHLWMEVQELRRTSVPMPSSLIGNKCPRCRIGVIIMDMNDKVCLCCGLREDNTVDMEQFLWEHFLNWLISNRGGVYVSPESKRSMSSLRSLEPPPEIPNDVMYTGRGHNKVEKRTRTKEWRIKHDNELRQMRKSSRDRYSYSEDYQ